MEPINYEDTRVAGGIRVFDDVIKTDRSKIEMGSSRIPSEAAAREYVRFLESAIESSRLALAQDDEALLAA